MRYYTISVEDSMVRALLAEMGMVFPIGTLCEQAGDINVCMAASLATSQFTPLSVDGVYIVKDYGNINTNDIPSSPTYSFAELLQLFAGITPTQITEDEFYTLVAKGRQ